MTLLKCTSSSSCVELQNSCESNRHYHCNSTIWTTWNLFYITRLCYQGGRCTLQLLSHKEFIWVSLFMTFIICFFLLPFISKQTKSPKSTQTEISAQRTTREQKCFIQWMLLSRPFVPMKPSTLSLRQSSGPGEPWQLYPGYPGYSHNYSFAQQSLMHFQMPKVRWECERLPSDNQDLIVHCPGEWVSFRSWRLPPWS